MHLHWGKNVLRTQWFSHRVKPKHVGIYERECPHIGLDIVYAYWDGKKWGMFAHSIPVALKLRTVTAYEDDIRWRGRVIPLEVNLK